MDLSLDDIIKKNKVSKQLQKKKKGPAVAVKNLKGVKLTKAGGKIAKKPLKKAVGSPRGALLDARSRIINKNRVKIRDAREKIAENARKTIKDARELLSTKKPAKVPKKVTIPRNRRGNKLLEPGILLDSDEDDEDFEMDELKLKPATSFKRTVQNDMYHSIPPLSMPKPPKFNINPDLGRLSPDPFDCYQLNPRRPVPVPPMRAEPVSRGFQPGRSMSAHMDSYPPKSILRTSSFDDHDDRFDSDRYFSSRGFPGSSSSETVRTRLYNESRGRDSESAGIFAKLPVRESSPPPPAQVGHRIVISNLHKSVTSLDVVELFEDIGELISAKLVRPGTAEVIYKNLADAKEAVRAYHNRQLDKMAMKCMLVPSSSSVKHASYSSRM